MTFQCLSLQKGWLLPLALLAPMLLPAQTTININNTVLQNTVRRFGINLGAQDNYDSGQMLKNLLFINPGFEGEIYQSTIRCGSGTSNSCTDENIYAGWPSGFWNNASYEMITGSSVGRKGTVCGFNSNPGTAGGTFTFCDSSGPTPVQGDCMIVRTTQNGVLAWISSWLNNVGNGTVGVEMNDLPPGTTGIQSAIFTAPTASDVAEASTFFDSTLGQTFIQLNGQYQLTFKAKGLSGSQSIALGVTRAPAGLTYINKTVPLTNTWQPYTFTFNASETGTSIGRVEISFATIGADSFELDDLSLVKLNTDPTNTTVFRDEVVNTLKTLKPGVMRFWWNQLGESLDNLIADPIGRQRSGYSPYDPYYDPPGELVHFQTPFVTYSLPEFLNLCEAVGTEPWFVMPIVLSDAEASNLIDYLAGGTNTVYGAKRAAAGHPNPYTSSFKTIHLEFGNEAWNGDFKGGNLEYADAYGARGQKLFSDMQSNPNFVASSFDLIVNGQSASPGHNAEIQSYITNNNSFSIAPYMMYTVDTYDTPNLFASTFAEAEAFVTNSGTSEGVANGYITQNQLAVTPKPIVTSEMNLSPRYGAITQSALNGYASSVGGGIAVIDAMFQQLRAGVLTQNLFQLPQWEYLRSDGSTVDLWGAVVDMGVTNRVRGQFLAEQLANSAIGNSTSMLQTQHTGFDPTYDEPLTNSVQLNGVHYLQSFAFTDGSGHYSLVMFNLSTSVAAPVNFGGAITPTGTVNQQQLTSANITDTNELSTVVVPTSTTLSNFNPSATFNLPPYSMTVLTWGTGTQAAPKITSLTANPVTSTTATISWTTDQPATSQVSYGTTPSYGSQSALNTSLTTSHSVILTGLTPGTNYDYAAISANSSNASTTSANSTFTTATAAPVISNVLATSITSTSAIITWTTDQASSSLVNYGTTMSYGASSTLNSNPFTSHSVMLTGLTPGTTYDYDVVSTNSTSNTSTSGNFTFVTTAPAAPIISSVMATSITTTSAVITWTTDQPSSSLVNYGTTTGYGSTASPNPNTLVTAHSVTLNGLTPGTLYDFDVVSTNSTSNMATSGNSTFTTSVANTPPKITAVTATSITSTSAIITWTTDQASSSLVNYGITTSYGSSSTPNSNPVTSHSVMLTGLTPGTTYDYDVVSTNATANTATSGNSSFATLAAGSSSAAYIGLDTTTQGAWKSGYGADGYFIANYASSSPSYATVTFNGDSTWTWANPTTDVRALTTTAGNGIASTYYGSSFSINVNLSDANTHQIALYLLDWDTTSRAETISILDAATKTVLNTQSFSGFHNGDYASWSVKGSVIIQVTDTAGINAAVAGIFFGAAPPATAPVISAVTATNITTTTATITWTTDEASSSQVKYGTTTAYGSTTALNATPVTTHSVALTGLTAGITYHYEVISAVGTNSTTSTDFTFATPTSGGTGSSATYNGTDTTTQGNWGGTYGADGYFIANDANNPPSYASVAMTGTSTWTFANNTADPRALQTSSGSSSRIASTYYGGTFSINVNFTDANTHQIALYLLDWDTTSRVETVSILDASTHAVLNTQTFSSFQNGQYASWNVKGNVIIQVTSNAGINAVVAGIFFGGTSAQAPLISQVAATNITATGATITWMTNVASSSQVNYGTTTAYGSASMLDPTPVTLHSVVLTGLNAGTTYNYDVTSSAGGSPATSANFTFLTSSSGGGGSSASYIGSDTTTQGAWKTGYGADGYLIANYAANPPSYATVSFTGQNTWTWVNPTSDVRALQTSGGNGIASTYYGTPFSINVNLSDTNTHRISLYLLDWDTTARVETISILDAATHTVLSTQTFSGFQNGEYASWNVKGNVVIQVANSAGINAVVSGIFFGGASVGAPVISGVAATNLTSTSATITWTTDQTSSSLVNYGTTTSYGSSSTPNSALVTNHSVILTGLTPGTLYDFDVVSANSAAVSATSSNASFTTLASGSSSATYNGLDTTTQGAWMSNYGAGGDYIANYASNPPAYATVSLTGQNTWTFLSSTTDPRALQTSGGNGIASTYYSASGFSINVKINDGKAHNVALYLLDWDTTGRSETISILDAGTNAVLNTQSFSGFHNGEYASWTLQGNVIIQVTPTGGINAVVAGIFFGL